MQLSMVNQGNGPKIKKLLMATITGNIATATNTGQLTYNALRRKGGRFYSDARLHDICVDAGQS